jgi:hypothetical protein
VDNGERRGAMSGHDEPFSHDHVPAADEPTVPELEEDETIAPRPEEEIADALRAEPDVEDHGRLARPPR